MVLHGPGAQLLGGGDVAGNISIAWCRCVLGLVTEELLYSFLHTSPEKTLFTYLEYKLPITEQLLVYRQC